MMANVRWNAQGERIMRCKKGKQGGTDEIIQKAGCSILYHFAFVALLYTGNACAGSVPEKVDLPDEQISRKKQYGPPDICSV